MTRPTRNNEPGFFVRIYDVPTGAAGYLTADATRKMGEQTGKSALALPGFSENTNDHSFPRSHRLCQRADYEFVFGRPVKSSNTSFTVLIRANGIGHARLGLAISKKNIKTAVARNRIKRLIRESFRGHPSLFASVDIIVLAKRGADKQNNQLLRRSLQTHWKKLGE